VARTGDCKQAEGEVIWKEYYMLREMPMAH